MSEINLEELVDGRSALEQRQTPADFTAKVEELAAPIKNKKNCLNRLLSNSC